METKVKAVVLGGIDYKEKDKLITLFTLEQGIVTVVFRGVKNVNAKLKSAKELFSFGDFILSEGKNKIVITADIIDNFFDITKDIKKYYCACAFVEAIKGSLMPQEANPQMFITLIKCLKFLTEDVFYVNVINKFLIELFQQFGYKFDLNSCNNCGMPLLNNIYMNLNYGDITCANCRMGAYIEISKPVYSAMRILSITNIDKLATIKIDQQISKQVFDVLALNFKNRFGKTLTIM